MQSTPECWGHGCLPPEPVEQLSGVLVQVAVWAERIQYLLTPYYRSGSGADR